MEVKIATVNQQNFFPNQKTKGKVPKRGQGHLTWEWRFFNTGANLNSALNIEGMNMKRLADWFCILAGLLSFFHFVVAIKIIWQTEYYKISLADVNFFGVALGETLAGSLTNWLILWGLALAVSILSQILEKQVAKQELDHSL